MGSSKTYILLVASALLFLVAQVNTSVLIKSALFAEGSCEGICNRTGTDPTWGCQCNTACVRFNDCCPDYYTLCLGQGNDNSCVGRCDQSGTIPGAPCQCNKPCQQFGDCCPDYTDVCGAATTTPRPGGITDKELEDLAEELFALEGPNNAAEYVEVHLDGKPLLTVAAAAYTRNIIEKLIKLHDNYNANVNVAESYTPEEQAEMDDFIDAIFATPIMQRTQEFLVSKNLPNGKEKFFEHWFGLYSRGTGGLGSCGFEHIFMGELKNGVSGFHNWVFWAIEEALGDINYLKYMDFIDFGQKGSVIEHNFQWEGQTKPISSMFIGTSPELELALYTVCWNSRKNAKCPISLNGNKIKIQTYTIGSSNQFVASAYPDLSD